MEFFENRTYKFRISDQTKLAKSSYVFAGVMVVLIIVISISATWITHESSAALNILLYSSVMLIAPLSWLLYYYRFVVKRANVNLSYTGIETNINLAVRYSEITAFKKVLDRNGGSTLILLKLTNGSKLAFNPANSYSTSELEYFAHFVETLEKAMAQHEVKTQTVHTPI